VRLTLVARIGRCRVSRGRASVPARLKKSCGDARPTRGTRVGRTQSPGCTTKSAGGERTPFGPAPAFGGNPALFVMSSEAQRSRDIWLRVCRSAHSRPDFSARPSALVEMTNKGQESFSNDPHSRPALSLPQICRRTQSPALSGFCLTPNCDACMICTQLQISK